MPLIMGFLAAALHVVSGPDHLAAVTPIAIETKRRVWHIGLFWGLGHLVGMLLIGGVFFFFFRKLIPLQSIAHYSEQMVGFVLILVGVWSLRKSFFQAQKPVLPSVGGSGHVQGYTPRPHYRNFANVMDSKGLSSFLIGVLHGLAGVSHFLLLLPILTLQNMAETTQYVGGFALGTIAAMVLYTLIVGKIATASDGNALLLKGIRLIGGLFAVVVGVWWVYLNS